MRNTAVIDDAYAAWAAQHDASCDDIYCQQGHRATAFAAGWQSGRFDWSNPAELAVTATGQADTPDVRALGSPVTLSLDIWQQAALRRILQQWLDDGFSVSGPGYELACWLIPMLRRPSD